MNTKSAVIIFESLTSEIRLSIFRLLVKYAPGGLVAGEIAKILDIPKTNLSFHLKTLVHGGLASLNREGRNTRYRACIPLMQETIDFMTEECCSGRLGRDCSTEDEHGLALHLPPLCCADSKYAEEDVVVTASEKRESANQIRETVRASYAAIANGQLASCCCSSQCCGKSNPAELAESLGYKPQDIAGLPEGANMGLSCGNPIALASLKEGQTVLDLGSGGGFDVFQAGEKVKTSGRVIGVDMTPEMLSLARKNIALYRQRSGFDNVEFRLGEIEHLPILDSSVDVVLSNCVINLSPDKPQVWREVFRVLKPGGKVFVSDIALLKPLPVSIQQMATAFVGCIAGAVLVEETKDYLEQAGFSSILLTPDPGYVRSMQDRNDPLYKKIADALPDNGELADYVASLSIEAAK